MNTLSWKIVALALCAGSVSAQFVDTSPRVNLAKFQKVTADSYWSSSLPELAVDGIVGEQNRWVSGTAAGLHWLTVEFPLAVELGSAQLFLGSNDQFPVGAFSLEYRDASGAWQLIPGASVLGNTSVEVEIVFTQPVTTDRVRFSTSESTARLKEIALYPPNNGGGYALGTDLSLNLARQRRAEASSINGGNYPKRAVDGFVDDNSRWLSSNTAGPHTLEVYLPGSVKIGSAHVYTGFGNPAQSVLLDFSLEWWDGAAWQSIPGGAVTNNTQAARIVQFSAPVTTDRVRFVNPRSGFTRLRELVVLPYNGGAGYPLGTSVETRPRPTEAFTDYHDSYYGLLGAAAAFAIRGSSATPDVAVFDGSTPQQYQLLLDVGTRNYWIRNRVSGRALQVEGASKVAGASVVEDVYDAMPHQMWRLETVTGSNFRIVNLFSGMALDIAGGVYTTGATLVQQPISAALTQQWRASEVTHYPKKGLAGWMGIHARTGHKWTYEWSQSTGQGFPVDVNFAPMVWGNYGWSGLRRRTPEWKRRGRQTFLMGFNEPDNSDQSNIPVDTAVDLWPRLEAVNQPIVGPGFTWGLRSWANNFSSRARSQGMRFDYTSTHIYSPPVVDNWMNELWSIRNRDGKDVWLTEFSNVDWSGNGNWDYKDNYEFLATLLWRMENASWMRRYAIFPFTGSSTSKRSNFFEMRNGSRVFTPIAELYSAWDGDLDWHPDTQYHIFGKSAQGHISSTAGGPLPGTASIFTKDGSVQWMLESAGGDRYFVTSVADGRRLRAGVGGVDLAGPGTSGPNVEWVVTHRSNGWHHVDNLATNSRLRQRPDGVIETTSRSNDWDSTRLRFIRPFEPAVPQLEVRYGLGCGVGLTGISGVPTAGGSANLFVFGAEPGLPAVLLVSVREDFLPLDLIGMTGCFLNVRLGSSLLAAVPSVVDGSLTGTASVPIPVGFEGVFSTQWVFGQSTLNSLGLGTTQGLRVIVR